MIRVLLRLEHLLLNSIGQARHILHPDWDVYGQHGRVQDHHSVASNGLGVADDLFIGTEGVFGGSFCPAGYLVTDLENGEQIGRAV